MLGVDLVGEHDDDAADHLGECRFRFLGGDVGERARRMEHPPQRSDDREQDEETEQRAGRMNGDGHFGGFPAAIAPRIRT